MLPKTLKVSCKVCGRVVYADRVNYKEIGHKLIYRGQEVRSYYIAWYKIPKHTQGLLKLFHKCKGSDRVFKRAFMIETQDQFERIYFVKRRRSHSL